MLYFVYITIVFKTSIIQNLHSKTEGGHHEKRKTFTAF